jgi:vacuolar-type H+-ATPase subunit I/STV1
LNIIDASSYGFGGTQTANLVYNSPPPPLTDEQKIAKSINDLHAQIKEKVMLFEGLVLELQRKTSKKIDFNETVYKQLESTENSLNEVIKNVNELTEQLDYAKDILDAIKTSQEISDGYKEYEDKKKSSQRFGHLNINGIINTPNISIGGQTINTVYTSQPKTITQPPTTVTLGDVFVDDVTYQNNMFNPSKTTSNTEQLNNIKKSVERAFTINGGNKL